MLQGSATKDSRAVTNPRPEGASASPVKEPGDNEGCRENHLDRAVTICQVTQYSQGDPKGQEAGEANLPLLFLPLISCLGTH